MPTIPPTFLPHFYHIFPQEFNEKKVKKDTKFIKNKEEIIGLKRINIMYYVESKNAQNNVQKNINTIFTQSKISSHTKLFCVNIYRAGNKLLGSKCLQFTSIKVA